MKIKLRLSSKKTALMLGALDYSISALIMSPKHKELSDELKEIYEYIKTEYSNQLKKKGNGEADELGKTTA